MFASAQGLLDKAKQLLTAGAQHELVDAKGMAVLDIATANPGNVDEGRMAAVTAVLLEHGARHSLMYAAGNGMIEHVRALVAEGCDATARNEDGKTSLMLAIEHGHSETGRAIIGAIRAAGVLDVLGRVSLGQSKSRRRIRKGSKVLCAEGTGRMGVVVEDYGKCCPFKVRWEYKVRWDDGKVSGWLCPMDFLHEVKGTALMMASAKGMTDVVEALLAGRPR